MGAKDDYDPFADEVVPASVDDHQLMFERAAIEAAKGWIDALTALNEALEREGQLKRQLRKLAE